MAEAAEVKRAGGASSAAPTPSTAGDAPGNASPDVSTSLGCFSFPRTSTCGRLRRPLSRSGCDQGVRPESPQRGRDP